jgi:hypothetical protein
VTLKELSVLYNLGKEIEMDKKRLEELETQHGTKKQKERVRGIIQRKYNALWEERERLEKWIANIPDSVTRQIFTQRFVNGKTWVQVAMDIGGGNTGNGVMQAAKRYAKKN